MNRSQYIKITSDWAKKYSVPNRAFRYDPREINLCCEKCGNHIVGGMARHHKANDFFFALWMPDVYAARYLEFRKDDCAKLCQRCHGNVERFYEKLKYHLYYEFSLFKEKTAITVEWCELWRERFIARYNEWLALPQRRRKNKKQRRKSRLVMKRKS